MIDDLVTLAFFVLIIGGILDLATRGKVSEEVRQFMEMINGGKQ